MRVEHQSTTDPLPEAIEISWDGIVTQKDDKVGQKAKIEEAKASQSDMMELAFLPRYATPCRSAPLAASIMHQYTTDTSLAAISII